MITPTERQSTDIHPDGSGSLGGCRNEFQDPRDEPNKLANPARNILRIRHVTKTTARHIPTATATTSAKKPSINQSGHQRESRRFTRPCQTDQSIRPSVWRASSRTGRGSTAIPSISTTSTSMVCSFPAAIRRTLIALRRKQNAKAAEKAAIRLIIHRENPLTL